jgi:metal-sulfur cluster biosynthetic enzyme
MNSRIRSGIAPTRYWRRGSGERRPLGRHARQPVEADELDEALDLRLRAAQAHAAPGLAQAPRDHREVDHQRRVGERQLREVDEQVVVGRQRARERAAAQRLRGAILITGAGEDRRFFAERDDPGNLPQTAPATLSDMSANPELEEVEDALTNVIDPELGLDFVELGLIYGIEIDGGHVHVTFTLTTPACPIGPQVTEQIEEFVSDIEGVESVESSMTFTPPWTPDKMSEDAKFALGY